MIELRNITKTFGAVLANDRVSFKVEPGTIHAIVGENGAGKSTAMRIVYGFYTPDSGEILVAPRPSKTSETSHQYQGVGGWLLLFCIVLTITSPLLALIGLGLGYSLVSPDFVRFPGLRTMMIVEGVFSLGLTAFGIIAGVALWTRKPNAVRMAKTYLSMVFGYSCLAIFLPLIASLPAERLAPLWGPVFLQLIRTLIFVAIWSLYLSNSKRVRATYKRREVSGIETPHDAIALGIGMVHQHFMLVEPMTVAENIVLGAEPGGATSLDLRKAGEEIRKVSDEFKLSVDPNATIETLSVGQQQRVELLKALYRHAQLLILDEPTAVLTPQEVEEFFAILRGMRAQGKTIVIITHKLSEVLAISDNVTVMRDGRVVGDLKTSKTNAAELARLMVGREVLLRVEKPDAKAGDTLISVRDFSIAGRDGSKRVDKVSFDVRAGEIVGIAGVEGNGQTELIEALAGLIPGSYVSGSISFEGRDITRLDARARKELGIAHVPEDRHRRGLLLDFSLAENTILGVHYRKPAVTGPGSILLDQKGIQRRTEQVIRDFDVRPPNPVLPARALSGGNQQKLIIGREFELPPKFLLVSQPTRGVDIGAIEFIHRKIVAMRDAGCAVLLVSAELEEVTALSDRLLVIHNGKIVGEVDPKATTNEEIGLMMTGGRD